jgi:broad specificity phosphatase PhoE
VRRTIPALAALFLLAIPPATAQKAVFVVRHAEKASDANDPDVPLSEAGRARAKKLAAVLAKAGVTAIYSTDMVRTLATAEPLAQASKIPVRKYAARDGTGRPNLAPLARRLKTDHARDVVLVVGHGDTVPPLLKALGCSEEIEIPADQYDDLFVVVPAGAGPPKLLRLTF